MHRKIERLRRSIAATPRIFASVIAVLALALSLVPIFFMMRTVTILDEGTKDSHVVLTNAKHPTEILSLVGVSASRADEVLYTASDATSALVTVRRAFPVEVTVDGLNHAIDVLDGTVLDVVTELGINLKADDFVTPALSTILTEDLKISINRVTYAVEVRREEMTSEDVDEYMQALESGELPPVLVASSSGETTAVEFKSSQNNMYDVTYRSTFINGTEDICERLALSPVFLPRPTDSTEFIDGVPCSTISEFEGISIGAEGIPTTYTSKISNASTTAYSSSGGRGASGLGLYTGTVAVNPNVIPYGTRLFITSPDNSFVYGYAIATDTGIALMDGRIDIDLYFSTNAECLRFGKRPMDIYVLD